MWRMRWKDYIRFERAILSFAKSRLIADVRRIARPKYSIPSVCLSLAVGFAVTRKVSGFEIAVDQLWWTVLYGFAALGVVTFTVIALEIFAAPYGIWKAQQDTITDQALKISGFEEKEKPVFELSFESVYPYIQENHPDPKDGGKTLSKSVFVLVRIKAATSKNCRGYLLNTKKTGEVPESEKIARPKLLKNKTTGVVFIWDAELAKRQDMQLYEPSQVVQCSRPIPVAGSLPLTWLNHNKAQTIDMSHGRDEYIGVFDADYQRLSFCIADADDSHAFRRFGSGQYELTVRVEGRDAEGQDLDPADLKLRVDYNRWLDDLKVVRV